MSKGSRKWQTNNTRFTGMIDVHQITIQIDMLILSYLYRSISCFLGFCAWRES